MVEGILALAATLAALAGAGTLVQRALKDKRIHLWVWAAATGTAGLALAALAVGQFAGFSSPVFRSMAITGALLAPACIAVGAIELCVKALQARFATRLIAVSYSLVAVVVLLFDPLSNDSLGDAAPHPGDVYGLLPGGLLTGAMVLVIVALLAAVATVVVRSQKRDKDAYELMAPAGLAAGAGLVGLVAVGYLPGLVKIIGLAAAAGMVWFAAWRTLDTADGADEEQDEKDGGARTGRAAGSGRGSRTERRDPQEKEAEDEMAYEPPRPHRARPDTHGMMRPEPPQPPQAPLPPRHTGSRPLPPQPPQSVPPQGPPTTQMPGPVVGDDWFAPAPPQPPQPSRIMGPYGQIVVYTLLDGREQAFDRQVNQLIGQAVQAEPGILIFTCHEVDGAPTQRISYQLFRDREAFDEHQGRPYVHRFQAESRTHVLATNVIDLKLTGGSLPVLR
ncbi:putative quinol monooxygenase [Actinocorallia libanotica]|uniref:ABM domain-containing protein n=1 Tax=Actinocorallia libanotica TaxID=46162 RepID=A0ABN1RQI2_9ACTN